MVDWSPRKLTELAEDIARQLQRAKLKLVLAESCTAGLAAATLGGIPGVSQVFCGSAVIYRLETKIAWLQVDPRQWGEPNGVGPLTTRALVEALFRRTPEADIAAAVTGYLGPGEPAEHDGQIYACCALAPRHPDRFAQLDNRLTTRTRRRRQQEATSALLNLILRVLVESIDAL